MIFDFHSSKKQTVQMKCLLLLLAVAVGYALADYPESIDAICGATHPLDKYEYVLLFRKALCGNKDSEQLVARGFDAEWLSQKIMAMHNERNEQIEGARKTLMQLQQAERNYVFHTDPPVGVPDNRMELAEEEYTE